MPYGINKATVREPLNRKTYFKQLLMMELKQAYELLKQAHKEYATSAAFENIMKGSARKDHTRKKELIKGRVHSIFHSCSELWNYAPDYFFSPTDFDGDFDVLMEKLKEELE